MIGLHRLNPGLANATSGADQSRRPHHPHDNNNNNDNIIKISAKTAQPQIVSSVPKCRNTKTSRAHPLDTINGSAINLDYGIEANSGRSLSSNHHHQQQQQQRLRKQQLKSDAEQMVLIVSDDNQAAPIIGRRLPSKSMGAHWPGQTSGSNGRHQQTSPHQQPFAHHLQYSHSMGSTSGAPVVGRRSNRLASHHNQQRHQLAYDCEPYQGQLAGSPFLDTDSPYLLEQQPLSIVETSASKVAKQQVKLRPTKSNVKSSAKSKVSQTKAANQQRRLQSLSHMNIADPSLMRDYNSIGAHGGYPAALSAHCLAPGIGRRSARAGPQSIGSPPPSPLACPEGCPCGAQTSPYPPNSDYHVECETSYVDGICHCYDDYPKSTARMSRSASCQRVSSCCAAATADIVPPVKAKRSPAGPRFTGGHRMSTGYPAEQPGEYLSDMSIDQLHHLQRQQQQRNLDLEPQRQARSSMNHHHQHNHHSTCQANEPQGPIAAALSHRPAVSYRSSSCHDQRGQRQPMLISGRNLLPVHPKPALNFPIGHLLAGGSQMPTGDRETNFRVRSGHPRSYQSPDGAKAVENELPDAGVSQMYESLAAELKAKLGDPKMGPILLPPKDYDTMSRKQGKLTGIELRRSTNPQLVGPTANRLAKAAKNCSLIAEESSAQGSMVANSSHNKLQKLEMVPTNVQSPVCGSSRSSGRSQDDDRSLQRSRSNSSSGLGSISMGAGSPNSSPSSKSSSSEDMRQASAAIAAATAINHNHNSSLSTAHRTTTSNFTKITINSSPGLGSTAMRQQQQQQQQQQMMMMMGQSNSQSSQLSINNKNILMRERKDSSPDYCGASDSGHSESGPPDEHKFKTSGSSDNSYSRHPESPGRANKQQDTSANRQQNKSNQKPPPPITTTTSSSASLQWNGRVEVPLKVNSNKSNGNTYLATKQIIY